MKTHSGAKKRFKVTAGGRCARGIRSRATSSRRSRRNASGLSRARRSSPRTTRRASSGCWSGQMTRVKRSVHARKKRRATLELTKGFRGEATRTTSAPRGAAEADAYAYRDRRNRKRDFRRLWITRINAAARVNGMSYSQFMHGLALAGCRARPQGAGRHRRSRRRDVPTFRRGRREASTA